MIPSWLGLALIVAAAWRTWHLLARDDLLAEARGRLFIDDDGEQQREEWDEWLDCPYCAGFWIGAAWCAAWWAAGEWALAAALPFAVSTGVIAAARLLDSGE